MRIICLFSYLFIQAGEEGRRISSEIRPGSESGPAEMLAQGEVPIAARREDGSPEKEENVTLGRQLAKTLLAIIHDKVFKLH